jgi:hypothetical protein
MVISISKLKDVYMYFSDMCKNHIGEGYWQQ